ncbi:CCA tRNA nucleotidyltransferase [Patescibacteria group bacterium]|nr:CCA tRNA nucleotidyltransferase [Patescibacteria group bacterium]
MKKTAIQIIKKLQSNGYTAYLAGGFVRDKLMGKKPDDFDIATSAQPAQIEKLLPKTISVGREFGVIIALEQGQQFEIATFRSDAGYSDGRRPDAVFYTNPQEDAKRRDFTINGMFYDPVSRKVIDLVDGQKDLQKKIVRFIGDPAKRIKEDHLRILRAVRFKNALGFKYDAQTKRAVRKNAQLIKTVSKERIKQELDKIWLSPNRAKSLVDLQKLGLLKHILPEVNDLVGLTQPYQIYKNLDVWQHTVQCLKNLPADCSTELVWAMLLHDIGKPPTKTRSDRIRFNGHAEKSYEMSQKILTRLHFSKKEADRILWSIKFHLVLYSYDLMKLSTKRKWLLNPYFLDLLELSKADTEATPAVRKFKEYKKIKIAWFQAKKQFPSIPKLISGREVMKLKKIKEGPPVGIILAKVKEAQLAGKIKTKKQAQEYVKKIKL